MCFPAAEHDYLSEVKYKSLASDIIHWHHCSSAVSFQ